MNESVVAIHCHAPGLIVPAACTRTVGLKALTTASRLGASVRSALFGSMESCVRINKVNGGAQSAVWPSSGSHVVHLYTDCIPPSHIHPPGIKITPTVPPTASRLRAPPAGPPAVEADRRCCCRCRCSPTGLGAGRLIGDVHDGNMRERGAWS